MFLLLCHHKLSWTVHFSYIYINFDFIHKCNNNYNMIKKLTEDTLKKKLYNLIFVDSFKVVGYITKLCLLFVWSIK